MTVVTDLTKVVARRARPGPGGAGHQRGAARGGGARLLSRRTTPATSGTWASTRRSTRTARSAGRRMCGSPAWRARRPGSLMPAEPRLGTPVYRQGFAPDIEFFDCGRVLNTGARTCVPGKCYKDVVVIDEWDPLDPEGGHQRKFHADGVGMVRVGAVNDPEAETLVLREVRRLGPRRMATSPRAGAQAGEACLRGQRGLPPHPAPRARAMTSPGRPALPRARLEDREGTCMERAARPRRGGLPAPGRGQAAGR